METYRMTIIFNDGMRPYHNNWTVNTSDNAMIDWIKNYAKRYNHYSWFAFIDYHLVNKNSRKIITGRITNED